MVFPADKTGAERGSGGRGSERLSQDHSSQIHMDKPGIHTDELGGPLTKRWS